MPDPAPDSPDLRLLETKLEHGVQQVLEIAVTAAQLASGVSLRLHQLKILPPNLSEHYAMLNRHLGELLEAAGEDDLASDFGATAALLRAPPA